MSDTVCADKVVEAIIKAGQALKNLITSQEDIDRGEQISSIMNRVEILFGFINPHHNDPQIKKMKMELLKALPSMNGEFSSIDKERIEKFVHSIL